jgi:uncharacterized repeat protein (TIGR01451 family)
MLSNDDNGIDDVQLESNDASSEAVLGQAVDAQNTDEIENDTLLTYSEDVQQLPIALVPEWASRSLTHGTVDDIANAILDLNRFGGGIICLNGGNYTGVGAENKGTSLLSGQHIYNVWVYGGSPGDNGTGIANINCNGYAFESYHTELDYLRFGNINVSDSFMYFNYWYGSYVKDIIYENCQSKRNFITIENNEQASFSVSGCEFINCNQTGNKSNFLNAKGVSLASCNFTNIQSGSDDYAFAFSGTTMNNVEFDNITTYKFMSAYKTDNSGHNGAVMNTQFKNIQSDDQFMWIIGGNQYSTMFPFTNTKFINCSQTNASGNDGHFAFVAGTEFNSCEFINISSNATEGYTFDIHGTIMNKVNFTGANMSGAFIHARKYDNDNHLGYFRDCIFEECQSYAQFLGAIGDNARGAIEVSRCRFINSKQTYDGLKDGRGQFVAAIGANIDSCEFINTSSGHHGGAICINDEIAKMYNIYRASSVTNTNFTNVKSAWFAVFVHGLHNDSTGHVEKPILIENCNFVNCTATEQYGAGIGISHDNTIVRNCKFINNTGGQGTAIMVGGIPNSMNDTFDGDNSKGNNIRIEHCTFINNTAQSHPCRNDTHSTGNGGAIYIYGNNTFVEWSNFENNYAESGNGSAIYIVGSDSTLIYSTFRNHTAVDGTVYIKGDRSIFNGAKFYNNTAECGAGIYAEGDSTVVFASEFKDNNVTNQGGALFLEGDKTIVDSNKFIHNEAVPSEEETTGLGGAVYVKGDHTTFNKNNFTHNIARNGSAIYTEGNKVRVSNETFNENQAWSYLLVAVANPEESYYNTTDVNVTVLHIGGDNIINAIHNKASYSEIMLCNVTYTHSSGATYHTEDVFVIPANGAENSDNGNIIYQDDREYLQNITLVVTHRDTGNVIYNSTRDEQNKTLRTNITGEVNVTLKKPVPTRSIVKLTAPLDVGDYDVYAEHPEDWNYKFIKATTSFKVIAYADLSINKTVSNATAHKGDTVYWNITVKNNGPNDAINVLVEDVIPKGLIDVKALEGYVGKFDKDNCSWYGFDLANGDSAVLMLKTVVNTTNKTLINKVNVTSTTEDRNLSNNNATNQTYIPPEADLEIIKLVSNKTVFKGDTVDWTIVVTNHGPDNATSVEVKDVIPDGLTFVKIVKKTRGLFDPEDGVWTNFDLKNGENATLTIRTKVDVHNKTLINKVNVTSDTYDPNETNNNASNETVALPETDLKIVKEVLNSTAHKGDVIYWNITVSNLGPDDAINVVVKDVIPKGLIDVAEVKCTNGTFYAEKREWSGFNLSSNTSVSLVIKTTVDTSNATLINKVNVTSDTHETDWTNNNDSDEIEIPPEADLEIIKRVSDKSVYKGDTVTWTIIVTNNGPDAAVNVKMEDVIPDGLTDVVKIDATAGTFDAEKRVWYNFTLKSDEDATLIIQTTVNATNKTLVNNVNVTSDTYDPDETNNNASNETFALPEADLKIVKEVLNDTAHKGDVIYWKITVTNLGPDEAINVLAKDVIPDGLTDVKKVECSNGTFDADKREWSGFNLSKGASANLVIMTTVDVTNKTLTNKVNVTSDTHDPDLSNNNDSDDIVIPPEADLSIVKIVLNETAHKGDVIYWSIIVTNLGPDDAVNVFVEDVIPDGLSGTAAVGDINGTFDANKRTWSGFDLANGASATLVIKTTVDVTNKTLTNKVNVTSDTYDPDETNNNDSDDIVIPPEADLSIVKVALNETAHKGDVIYWSITVTNNGPDNAVNVFVEDVIPDGLSGAKAVGDITGIFDASKGTWYGFNLTNGASATLQLMTTVDVTNRTLTNKVNVTSDTYDPNETNNNDSDDIPIPPEADLEIAKLVSNKSAIKGDTVDWTIIVTNNGPDAAVNVTVADVIPEGLIDVKEVECSAGKFDADKLVWNQFDLASGAKATLVIRTTVNVSNATLVNKVNVTSDTYDPDTANNNASNETGSSPEADLSIVKLVSDSTAIKGDVITWTIEVTNNGPDTAVNVVVKDALPDGLVDASVSSISAGEFKNGVWSGFDLDSGKTATLVIETTVDTTNATIVNKANVTSDTRDPDTTNNNASNETVVSPEADLSIVKKVSDAAVDNGDVISWTIVVTNNGPDAAVKVVVKDAMPGELAVLDADPSKGSFENNVWSGFDLASGESATLVVKTRVDATNTIVVNKVNVTSDTYDPNETNNNASNETVVSPEADLSIVKEVSDAAVHNGDAVYWTIKVTNNGPDAAANVVVTDAMPDDLVDVSVYAITAGEFKNGVWSGFNLDSGKTATLVLKTTVNATGATIVNRANVTSDTRDPDTKNNNASNETVVSPEADLSIVKEVSNGTIHKSDVIYWTVTVTNNGPDAAANVVVNDAIPAGLSDVSVYEISAGEFKNNVWSGFSLDSGKTAALVLKTTASVSNKTIVNTVDVKSDTYDPDKTNNEASNKTYVTPEVDLNIKEYVSNETARNGDIIYWKIVVNNTGSDNAENVIVKDILPDGLEIIDVGASQGEYKDGVWSGFDLPGDGEAVLYIATRVNSTKFTIDNKPSVDSDTYDTNPENNNASNETILLLEADLELIKNVSPKSVHMGDIVTWEIVVINHGPDDAMNAFATDLLPEGLEYVSDDSDGKFDFETGIWDLGNLPNGETRTLHIKTKVLVSNDEIINNANVTSETYDPNMDNNYDDSSVTVAPEVDLAISITPKATKAKVGDKIEFVVKVVNNGPDGAVNAIATIELPDELKLLKFKPSKGTFDPETGIWEIGDLAPGEEVTLLLTTEALAEGKFVIDVSVTCDNHETDYTNNDDSAMVEVEPKNETPIHNDTPAKHSKVVPAQKTMPATGNPIAMVLLSLLAIVGISFKRKNKF